MLLIHGLILLVSATSIPALADPVSMDSYPRNLQTILDSTRPLEHPLGQRMPLLLWPVQQAMVEDEVAQESIIRDLDTRGIAMIATWNHSKTLRSLADSLRIARIQQKLGLPVYVNAIAPMYAFYNQDPATGHLDDHGNAYFDPSIRGGKIGCPYRIQHRYEELTEQIAGFVRAYQKAGVPLDFVFGDWEVDGPLEINRAWEASKRCVICRKHLPDIESFAAFQKAVRIARSDATKHCYVEPILSAYPDAWIGNYGVYPHDGYRYWFDYFEVFVEYHPHIMDQRAPYRTWYDDFPLTGYTMAMPVVYPWARTFLWYDYQSPDYRWFYNMLKVASNAGAHTPNHVPIVPFVHFQTIYEPDPENDSIQSMSRTAYEELLWHMLLRGTDTFFMWCRSEESEIETPPVHQVWAASLAYVDWLDKGEPVIFDVPAKPGPIVSAIRWGNRLLVRRTDFDDSITEPITILVEKQTVTVPRQPGRCQIIEFR